MTKTGTAESKRLQPTPDAPQIDVASALAHWHHGQQAAAVQKLELLAAANPDQARVRHELGNMLVRLGRAETALPHLEAAAALDPLSPKVRCDLGNAFARCRRTEEALTRFREAIALDNRFAPAQINLGIALLSAGRDSEAVAVLSAATRLAPDSPAAWNGLANAYQSCGRVAEAVGFFGRAIELMPELSGAHSNLVYLLNFLPGLSLAEVYEAHRAYAALQVEQRHRSATDWPNAAEPGRRLRIGYVSPDFRQHVTHFFIEEVLRRHDRARFEVFCYAEVPSPDAVTERLESLADGWRSTVGVSDANTAKLIVDDRIDILVDLAGHTAHNRLPVFGFKPAPVQVSWLGYPNTTGLTAIDYVFATRGYVPEGQRRYMSEEVYDLPRLPSCYRPPDDAPEVAETPARAGGAVTFGCFNNLTKVTPEAIAVWAALLNALPGARLLMKAFALGDPATRETMRSTFVAHGVSGERLILEGPSNHRDYLRTYGRVDIALDPFPYNGGTTTIEALYMGVPLVALRGDRWVSRNGSAILEAMGLEGLLVGDDHESYVVKAAALASDVQRLAELRREIRPRLLATGIADAALLTSEVEAAYREMWKRWCAKRANPVGAPR
ncbi:MAG: tetratricopeptide repeat protein [Kiloniellales bacterium]